MAELETILRKTNDIIDDPEVTEQLREKRMRARWAEAARTRYQRYFFEDIHFFKMGQNLVYVCGPQWSDASSNLVRYVPFFVLLIIEKKSYERIRTRIWYK